MKMFSDYCRFFIAFILSLALSFHGYKRKSLNFSGSIAAFLVGFISLGCSYRFGLILIMFYYTSSKLTKVKEDVKSKLESDYNRGGQRNWIQVFANSILATLLVIIYFTYCGHDRRIHFTDGESFVNFPFLGVISQNKLSSYIWCMYISHYATAAADTWGSEIGILSNENPRLITSLFFKKVPPGTNGGMSLLGTLVGSLGGAFIGFLFVFFDFLFINFDTDWTSRVSNSPSLKSQFPMITFGLLCGIVGSAIDSLLGATLQATYYNTSKKYVVKNNKTLMLTAEVIHICGKDVLSNEAVNFISIGITMYISLYFINHFFDNA